MGGGNWRHATATAALLVVLLTGCSPDDIGELPPETQASPTSAETTTTTAVTSAPPTTLSETAAAQAEIEQLLIDFWTKSYDGEGQDGGPEFLTGLIEVRTSELVSDERAKGYETSNSQNSVIEVTSIELDLDQGTAEASSCGGSAVIQRNGADGEIVFADDPDFLFTSDWILELTDEGWRIADWFPSANDSQPELCTIQNS